MVPSKNRSVPSRSPRHQQKPAEGPCSCLSQQNSSGICDLDVWLGTTVDRDAASSGRRMLRPNLPILKSKQRTLFRFPGHLYRLVSMNWFLLISVFVGAYVGVVGPFALLLASCHGMNQDSPGNARNFFNLSLQTLSTTGYGTLNPGNACSSWISVLESFSSMLLTSFMTGITFVKFARPHPTILFSEVLTVSQEEEHLEMRFRVANETRRDILSKGDIIDIGFKLILMRVELDRDGEPKLCYYDLKLETARLISLRLDIELVHAIDASSPLYKHTSEDLARSDFVLILIASGLDENIHDMIHAKREYGREEVRWGSMFQPMLDWDTKHKYVELDLDKISSVVSAPIFDNRGSSIDVKIENPPEREGSEHLRVSSYSSPSDDIAGADIDISSPRIEKHMCAEDTLPHQLADKCFCGMNNENDQNRNNVEKTNESHQSDESIDNFLENVSSLGGGNDSQSGMDRQDIQWSRNVEERPMSLLQRRVRVRNRSRCFMLNGLYQRALSVSWPGLLFSLVIAYVSVVAGVALLISVSINEPLEQRMHDTFATKYQDVFFFCVQTISTVGYGVLSPRQDSDTANFYVFVLVFSSIFVSTLFTGITWAKFSIPKASTLLYSDALLLTTFHSNRAIMFRAANNRKYGILVEGSFRMSIVTLNRNLGRRETHELRLVRNVWPIINLCNTLTHIIDESSPLYSLSTSALLSGDHFFFVLFTGVDNIVSDAMIARKMYHASDILVDHHFEDNITLTAEGLYIDLDAINATYCESNNSNQNYEEEEEQGNAANSPRSSYELLGDK